MKQEKMFIIIRLIITISFLTILTKGQSANIIKLKPVYLTENHQNISSHLNISRILVAFQTLIKTNSIKRLQLIFKQTNIIQQNLFYINNTDLTLNANLTSHYLDREYLLAGQQCEDDCTIRLKVASYDSTNSIQSIYIVPIVIIDLNDHKPIFRHTLYRVNISENLISSTQIPLDAPTDLDSHENGIKQCSIESSTTKKSTFEAYFNRETHRLYLVVNEPLDRENVSQYDLILICTDGIAFARTKLHIDVLDANDNVPYFKNNKTLFTINENSNDKFDLQAFDKDDSTSPNGQLVYSLPFELNSYNELFHIDELNGTLTIRSNATVDYEKKSNYNLKVKVQDKGANPVPVYTDVYIDVIDQNDNAPQGHLTFVEKYLMKQDKLNNTIWIYEELMPNQTTLAYLTVTDLDTSISNGHTLHAELVNQTVFHLSPIVQEYDNLYYALQIVNRIDREKQSYFDLTFKLSDKQLVSYLNLRIILLDTNDNKPIFQNTLMNQGVLYTFDLYENRFNSGLNKIKAIDYDLEDNLKYEIIQTSNNSTLPFEINNRNGDLKQLKLFDRESIGKYVFKVRCIDSGRLYTDILVQINVLDENDNYPLFKTNQVKFELEEEQPIGTIVGNVKALDADLNSSVFYFMKPDSMNNFFIINNSTGNLMTKAKLDADVMNDKFMNSLMVNNNTKFQFELISVDLDKPLGSQLDKPLKEQKLNIEISLIDINDNKPIIINTPNITVFDLNNSSINSTTIVQTIKTIDYDRDFVKFQNKHLFRINYIKRVSWSYLHELSIQTNKSFVSFVNHLNELKQEKTVQNTNLRQLFSLKNNGDLILKNIGQNINTGIYVFGIQIIDKSSEAMSPIHSNTEKKKKQFWRTEFLFKLYLTDTNKTNEFNLEEIDLLNTIIENWLSKQQQIDNNGDDLDLIKKDDNYSIARGISFTSDSSNIKRFIMNTSSNSIIIMISICMLIAVLLISLISYKHYKTSSHQKHLNSTTITEETNSNSTNSPSVRKALTVSSTASNTVSTNLTIQSLNNNNNNNKKDELDKANLLVEINHHECSASSSFFESYNQANLKSMSEHQVIIILLST